MNATGTGLRWGHRVSSRAATLFLVLVLAAAAVYFTHAVTTQPAGASRPATTAMAHAVDPVGDGHRQNLPAPRQQVNPAGDGHVAY